ncbi:M20 family metallopeptidase [Actinomadura viridis]|uniref:Succinyl-diaminopimelate desuccinylase n=1 Tax=Actinomadura viridis TaxID=58110 RepID=A0A931GM49_9ACTN|nr:M20/M25/M40 family metallo-hydrolase [Actinomadura viridis]MBG6088131.1 succinyl-diaminopimelate desuccinylase [Actinomadura viridis]
MTGPAAENGAAMDREAVDLARRLVRLDTRAGGERPAADLVAGVLGAAGFRVHVDEPVAGRANLIARYGPGTPAITFTGHLDTVPARAEEWSFDPMSGEIRDGRLLGRGASDMKAGVAAQVAAAVRHAREHPEATGPQLVFTFGEETGCDGAALLDPSRLVPAELLVVAEPTGNSLVLGHKGALWLRLTARGVSAHGSRPELGRNAIAALAGAALRVHGHAGWPESPTHGRATVNVGTFHSGAQPNLVPDHAEMCLDIRTVPGFGSDEAVAEIARLCGPDIAIERMLDLPGVATDPGVPGLGDALEALVPGSSARPPAYATFFTDASVLRDLLGGPAVVVYGPGDAEQAHVTDESCSVANIVECAGALHRLLRSRS